MKNISIVLGSIFSAIVAAIFLTWISSDDISRYHQHLKQKEAVLCTQAEHKFCTNLPIVSIDSEGILPSLFEVERNDKKNTQSTIEDCYLKIFDNGTGENSTENHPSFKNFATFRYRGNSSIYFDKKSYKIKLTNKDGTENRENSFLGMPAHDEWILNGPYLDKTLIRNYLCLNIAGEIRMDTPKVRFFELFLNGKYQGVYLAMESISYGMDRLNLTKYNEGDPFSSYIIRADRDNGQPNVLNNFLKYAGKIRGHTGYEIIYPPASKLNPTITRYIEEDMSKIEKAIYSYDYDDRLVGNKGLLNVNSFVDYFIINEFFQNYDAGIYSTYFYKDLKEKLNIGPVWDFNNSCDNYMENSWDRTGFQIQGYTWYFMLSKDDEFTESVIRRYRKLRKTVLSEDYLMNYIDQTVSWLGDSVKRNYEVWGYTFDPVVLDSYNKLYPDKRNLTSYDAAIGHLKSFIVERGNWLDKNIENLKQYSHESQVKKFNH